MSSNEEVIINDLVNEIFLSEEKISQISNKNSRNNQLQLNQENKKFTETIENLRIEIELENKLYNKKKQEKNTQIREKEAMLKKVMDEIDDLKGELMELNLISESSNLGKYLIENNNWFLTKGQIKEIMEEVAENQNENYFDNARNRKISQMENCLLNKKKLTESISKLKEELSKNEEILRMLKEDYETNEDEIANYISTKESLFEIIQGYITKFKNNFFDEEDAVVEEICAKLDLFEIANIDITKFSQFLTENIFDILEYYKNTNYSNKDYSIINFNKSQSMSPIRINNYTKAISSSIDDGRFRESNNQQKRFSSLKDGLFNSIKEEIFNFIKPIKMTLYLVNSHPSLQNLISSISNAIKNTISYGINTSDIKLFSEGFENRNIQEYFPNEILNKFIRLNLKYMCIDTIVENKLAFISKEYEVAKKNKEKLISDINSQLYSENLKLEQTINELKNHGLSDKQIRDMNYKGKMKLTQKEKDYIEISNKGNFLIQKQNAILLDIKSLRQSMEKDEDDFILSISKYKGQIEELTKKDKKYIKDAEEQKIRDTNEINHHKDLISNGYDNIKSNLRSYKKKNGSNLEIYNRFLDSINNTLNNTGYLKRPKNFFNSSINNNDSYSNNQTFTNNCDYSFTNNTEPNLGNPKYFKPSESINVNNENNKNYFLKDENDINRSINLSLPQRKSKIKEKILNIPPNKSKKDFDTSEDETSFNFIPFNKKNSVFNLNKQRHDKEIKIEYNHPVPPISFDSIYHKKILTQKNTPRVNSNMIKKRKNFSLMNAPNNNANSQIINRKEPILIEDQDKNMNTQSRNDKTLEIDRYFKNKEKKLTNNPSSYYGNGRVETTTINNISAIEKGDDESMGHYSRSLDKYDSNNYLRYQQKLRPNRTYYWKESGGLNDYPSQEEKIITISSRDNSNSKEMDKKFSNTMTNSFNKRNNGPNLRNSNKILKAYTPKIGRTFNVDDSSRKSNDKDNLSMSVKNLKETIEKECSPIMKLRSMNPKIVPRPISSSHCSHHINEKIYKLTQICFCHYRICNLNDKKLNPFKVPSNYSLENSFNLIKGTISLNKNLKEIIISSTFLLKTPIKIALKNIDGTIIHSSMKKITEIIKDIIKFKKSDLGSYLCSRAFINSGFKKNEVIIAAQNKIFNFIISLKNKKKLEVVLTNFEDFKTWINGIAYIVQNHGSIYCYDNN